MFPILFKRYGRVLSTPSVTPLLLLLMACAGAWPANGHAQPLEQEAPTVETVLSTALTLPEALERALQRSPILAAFSWEMRAAEARVVQAGLRPNPEFSLEIEEVRWNSGPLSNTRVRSIQGFPAIPAGVSPSIALEREREEGSRAGLAEAEFTLSIAQVVELGGKRAKRVRLAENEQELAKWDFEAARANVIEAVASAFVNVLAAQARLELHTELVGLAEQVHQTVDRQVQAGAVSPLEENRTKVLRDSTLIEQERAARELQAARAVLAATWGEARPDFERAVGRLDAVHDVPPLETLETSIQQNPDIARWAMEMTRRDAALALARAQRVPNPTFGLGFRSTGLGARGASALSFDTADGPGFSHTRTASGASRDNSLVLGFSVPLPLFDRNQGNIREAEHLIQKTGEERRSTLSATFAALAEAYQGILAAHNEIQVLDRDIIPTATENFEKTQEGYRQGKFGYIDVLDAERTLFDVRRQYLDALATYHTQLVRLERLTGLSLSAPETSGSGNMQETTHEN